MQPSSSPKSACLIYGAPLRYPTTTKEKTCEICGRKYMNNAWCKAGHFVCNACHAAPAISVIRSIAVTTLSNYPFAIAIAIIRSTAVHMDGPEHHVFTGAALLAAYRNPGGEIDLPAALE